MLRRSTDAMSSWFDFLVGALLEEVGSQTCSVSEIP
jgi:hypothetical protein